jgi:hypothetical protein
MADDINVNYLNGDNIKVMQELYNKFIEKYKIRLTKGGLFVKERCNNSGIIISPEEGEIYGVASLKPSSELELTLKENDYSKDGFLLFETKDSKFILVNYTNKYK